MTHDEAALIDRLIRRDRSTVEQVVRAHHGFLIAIVTPLVGSESAECRICTAGGDFLAATPEAPWAQNLRERLHDRTLHCECLKA